MQHYKNGKFLDKLTLCAGVIYFMKDSWNIRSMGNLSFQYVKDYVPLFSY
jgi:hypothetical protein